MCFCSEIEGGVRSNGSQSSERQIWKRKSFQLILYTTLFHLWFGECCSSPIEEESRMSVIGLRQKREASLLDASGIVPEGYNIHVSPPTVNGTPTDVQVAVLIVNVRDIKELTEELTLELNLKMFWKDERLRHLAQQASSNHEPFIVLNAGILQKLWHPDIYIDHVKAITQPSIISKPASLRIYRDSTLRYSARLTLAQSCQMDFHHYPADTQRCSIELQSYAYNDATLNLTWNGRRGASLVSQFSLPNVHVGLDNPENFAIVTKSGRYAGLRFAVLLRRKLSYHLLQTYLPSTLFIFVSWQSFLVPVDSVPGRMALCMTTLLTLTAMFSSVRQNTPTVSYIKAIDVWMVSCIIFVFLTLLEYTVLLKLKSLEGKMKKKKSGRKSKHFPMNRIESDIMSANGKCLYSTEQPMIVRQLESPKSVSLPGSGENSKKRHRRESFIFLPTYPNASPPTHHPPPSNQTPRVCKVPNCEDLVEKIESTTSAVIPILFVIFNFVYWPWLIHSSNYQQQFNTTVYYSAN